MSFVRNAFQTMHPVGQVVMMFAVVFTLIAVAQVIGMNGVSWLTENPRTQYLLENGLVQMVGFLGGALAFSLLVGKSFLGNFFTRMSTWQWLMLATLISLSMSPALDMSFRLNEWALIEGSSLHVWAEGLEKQAAELTQSMLSFQDSTPLWPVVVSVALLPAICEEWVFRGTLQPIVARATKNYHAGIWISAVLFSAIHMQFFGFLPRLLLGASFGYLVVHSGSIWPAILAHFVNNVSVVLMAWWNGDAWLKSGLEPQPFSDFLPVDWAIMGVSTVVLLVTLRGMSRNGNPSAYMSALRD